MNGQARSLRGEVFPAQRYETLRSAVLGCATAASHPHGLALLMHQGMGAWMQAWARYASPPRAPQRRARGEPPTVRPEMVAVLAEMALAAAHQERVT